MKAQFIIIAVLAVAMMFVAGCTSQSIIPEPNHDGKYQATIPGVFGVYTLTETISGHNTQFENCVGNICLRSAMVDNGNGTFTVGGAPSKFVQSLITFEDGKLVLHANDGSIVKYDRIG